MTKAIAIILVFLFAAAEARAAQTVNTTAIVVCGKSEQPTPCVLILHRTVPSYELSIKNDNATIATFKVERVKDAWEILGQRRKEKLIEVIVDTKDSSCVVFNPRLPGVANDLIPDGCEGLLIKTVEVKQ